LLSSLSAVNAEIRSVFLYFSVNLDSLYERLLLSSSSLSGIYASSYDFYSLALVSA
jgi:hypothetical protein